MKIFLLIAASVAFILFAEAEKEPVKDDGITKNETAVEVKGVDTVLRSDSGVEINDAWAVIKLDKSLTGNCEKREAGVSTCNVGVHYCAINYEQIERGLWGTHGYCSTSPEEDSVDDFSQISRYTQWSSITTMQRTAEVSFSSWPDFRVRRDSNSYFVLNSVDGAAETVEILWNWRRDWYKMNNCPVNPDTPVCRSLVKPGEYDTDHTMYYRLSTDPDGAPPRELNFHIKNNKTKQ